MERIPIFKAILRNYDPQTDDHSKARLIISFGLFAAAISLGYWIIHPLFNFHVPRFLFVTLPVGVVIIGLFLYLRFSLFFVATTMISFFWISFMVGIMYSGGIYSLVIPWLALMPMMAHILINQTASKYWIVISVLSIMFFYFNFKDVTPLRDVNGDYRSLFSGIGLVVTIFLFADIFNNTKQRLLDALTISNKDLRTQRELTVAQNAELKNQHDEIVAQHDFIQKQNELLRQQNVEIERVNDLLLKKVNEIFRSNETLEKYWNILLEISKSKSINFGTYEESLRHIIKTVALGLNTHRVSVWEFNDERNSIQCKVIYEAKEDRYSIEEELLGKDFPRYFEALRTEEIIPADEASANRQTFEFRQHYLEPKRIISMMDTPYFIDGKLGGVLCCEHKDEKRHWKPEDILFAQSLSDIITLAYRASQRREYEMKLRLRQKDTERENMNLEEQVKLRTLELQAQNRQLTEYAFINSHLLRGPLSRILGLINLINYSDIKAKETELIEHLKLSSEELDDVVKKITGMLNAPDFLDKRE